MIEVVDGKRPEGSAAVGHEITWRDGFSGSGRNRRASITSKSRPSHLADQPADRFKFTFTPKHGSWLNLVEGFFSKLARSILRHIRVSSKQELKERLMAAVDYFNDDPVVHTWTYNLDKAA
jgi:transposase